MAFQLKKKKKVNSFLVSLSHSESSTTWLPEMSAAKGHGESCSVRVPVAKIKRLNVLNNRFCIYECLFFSLFIDKVQMQSDFSFEG